MHPRIEVARAYRGHPPAGGRGAGAGVVALPHGGESSPRSTRPPWCSPPAASASSTRSPRTPRSPRPTAGPWPTGRRQAPRPRVPPVPSHRAQAAGRQPGAAHLRGRPRRGRAPARPRRPPVRAGRPTPAGELAPRDVVARAVAAADAAGGAWLDARPGGRLRRPASPASRPCSRRHELDAARDLLPVAPALHYAMGGIQTDLEGRASLPGLWAAGEVASHRRPRRQPAGVELAARGPGVRRPGGPRDRHALGRHRRRPRRRPPAAGAEPRYRRRRRLRADPARPCARP